MSDAVSALAGAEVSGIVRIEDAGLRGMVTLRGDLASDVVRQAAEKVAGVAMPGRREARTDGARGLLWMSPDELLVLLPHGEAAAAATALSEALAGTHHLAVDVSDARAIIRLTGEEAALREVLAKLTPADMRAEALPVGEVRRTRLAQVAAAFWFSAEGEAFVICFRSVADYVFGLLEHAARPGSEVGHF